MDRVWWEQITKASLFCRKIIDALSTGDSVVLKLPQHVPWYDTLVEIINEGIVNNGLERSIAYVEGVSTPGKYLLDNFCKKEIRIQYRPGKSYAAFLAEQDSITLNSTIVWVKDVEFCNLNSWLTFIHEYNRMLPKAKQGGLFLLEYRGEESVASKGHIQCISFSSEISAYDKYTFCTLVSASAQLDLDNRIKPYLAELVSTVCADDIELCAQCIKDGVDFAKDPAAYLQTIEETMYRSDGSPYSTDLTIEEIRYRIWESQIRMVFPLLERFRMQFVTDHHAEIARELPIETSFGERIEIPEDTELGHLYYLTSNGAIQMRDNAEWPTLRTFKEARNDLAHLSQLPFDKVFEILTWTRNA